MNKLCLQKLMVSLIKPTDALIFTNLFLSRNSTCFGQFFCPSSGVFHCTFGTGICHAGLMAAFKHDLVVLESSKAVCKPVCHIPLLSVQWINSWRWTDEMSETCRVSCQNKFVKLVHPVDFIIKKNCSDARSHEHRMRSFSFLPISGHWKRIRTVGIYSELFAQQICFHGTDLST